MKKRTKALLLTVLAHVADANIEKPQTTNQHTPPQQKSLIKWKKADIGKT